MLGEYCSESELWTTPEDVPIAGGTDTKAGGADTGAVLEARVVRRGRVDRGRTVGLSWAAGEGGLAAPGSNDAAEAAERPELAARGVYI